MPVLDERTAADADGAVAAAEAIGFPVVVKLCGDAIAHKTERGLVRLGLARRGRGARRRRRSCSRRRAPEDGAVELLVAPMVRGHARADRRPRARPAVRSVRDARRSAACSPRRSATSRSASCPLATSTPTTLHRRPRDPEAARPVPRRARGRPRRARAPCCRGLSRLADERARRRVGRREPAHRRRRPPGRGRRARRARRPRRSRLPRTRAHASASRRRRVPGAVRAARRGRRGRVDASGQVRLRRAAQHPRRGLSRDRSRRRTSKRCRCSASTRCAAIDELARRSVGPRVRVHAGAGERRAAAAPRAKQGIGAAFLTSGGLRRSGRRRAGAPKRELVALADELGILLAGPNGQGVVSTPARLCAQIVAPYPPPGRIAIASQSGQLRVVVPELGGADRRRREPRGLGGQRGRSRRRRLPRLLRRRSRDRGEPRLRRRRRRRPRALRAAARASRARKPVVLVKGGDDERRRARRGEPHRIARLRRPRVRRHVPPGRRHARRDDRRGVRGGGDVRDAAAAARAARRGAHDRGRLGRRDRRRDRAHRRARARARCPTTCAPRSTRSCRRAGAATTRSTSPAARRATRSPR